MKKIFLKIWPVGIIVCLWLLFAFPYWGKGLVPFPSTYLVTFFAPWSATHGMPVKNNAMPDVITQIYPWKRVTIDAWKKFELPLWNPYSFSGTSHVGNYQSAIFSPINTLFFILPEIHAWSVMILLQPLLAGVFMFIFLQSLSISKKSSVLGSIAYMFCGFITVWMAYGTLSYAVAFLPGVVYGIYRYIQKKDIYGGLWISLGLALSFFSGHFQMSIYVLLYAIGFIVYLGISTKEKILSIHAFILVLLGVSIAAPQILPSFDAYTQAVRSSLFIKGEVIPWQYIATLFSPDFYGNPVTRNDWFGHYAEWASFIGVTPLLLAMFALFTRWKARPVSYFVIMFFTTLSLAFQTPLVDLLFALKIPVLSTSSASRIIVLMSFSLAVLASYGSDVIIRMWEKHDVKKIGAWIAMIFCLLIFVWIVLLVIRPLAPDKLYIATRNTYLPTIIAMLTVFVSIIGLFLPKRMIVLLPIVLIAFTSIDMYRFVSKWMPFDQAAYVYPVLPVISKLQSLTASDYSRVFGNVGNELGSAFGLQLIEGYDAVYPYRYGRFISSVGTGIERSVDRSVVIFEKRGQYSEDMLQFLGVKYYAHKKSDGRLPWAYPFWDFPQYNRVWEDDNFEIFENKKSFPRAFLASGYIVASTDKAILDAFYDTETQKQHTIILEEKPNLDPMAGEGIATISSYSANAINIDVQTSVPKLLFLSDTYDSGWKATIDGKPAKIHRANFDFRAVEVPNGTHVVRMWYVPRGVTYGFWIAGFATLGLVGCFIWKRKN